MYPSFYNCRDRQQQFVWYGILRTLCKIRKFFQTCKILFYDNTLREDWTSGIHNEVNSNIARFDEILISH